MDFYEAFGLSKEEQDKKQQRIKGYISKIESSATYEEAWNRLKNWVEKVASVEVPVDNFIEMVFMTSSKKDAVEWLRIMKALEPIKEGVEE